MTPQPVDCTEQVERLADLVAERLLGERNDRDLIDVAEAARRLGVSRDFVYRNAEELGVIRLGNGPRSRLRFDPVTVGEWFVRHADSEVERQSQGEERRFVRRARSVDLLPIKGESV